MCCNGIAWGLSITEEVVNKTLPICTLVDRKLRGMKKAALKLDAVPSQGILTKTRLVGVF